MLVTRPAVPSSLWKRLNLLKWVVPVGLTILVVLYESVISPWIQNWLGAASHGALDVLVYGTVGPSLAFWSLHFFGRWLEERETSELQASILAQAQEQARRNQAFTDSTLQSLFATSLMLQSAQSHSSGLPTDVADQLHVTQRALDQTIHSLREHLLKQPKHLHTIGLAEAPPDPDDDEPPPRVIR
jgi:hypothetical protein